MESEITFKEAIRARPAMYFGSRGLRGFIHLISNLFYESIDTFKKEKLSFTFIIHSDNEFTFEITTPVDPTALFLYLTLQETRHNLFFQCLPCVTTNIEIAGGNTFMHSVNGRDELIELPITATQKGLTIRFEIDKLVFQDLIIDYDEITEALMMVAVLNKDINILLTDNRMQYPNQNYFHYPDSIQYLYRRHTHGEKQIDILIEETLDRHTYQIALGFIFDFYHYDALTLTFANDEHTSEGGSLNDGIADGIYIACKQYMKAHQFRNFQPNRKKLQQYVIAVGIVRGSDLIFAGSTKCELSEPLIRKETKGLVKNAVFKYLCNNTDAANKLLDKFKVYTPEDIANLKPNTPEYFQYTNRKSGINY